MGKLDGKVAFITGASKGIGQGIAKVYAKHGAKVVLLARSSKVDDLAKELNDNGFEALAVKADVSNIEDVKRAVEEAAFKFGKIDILVSNAGVCKLDNFLEMTGKDRDFHIDINIKGTWNVCRAVLPLMVEEKYGKVVIMSSVTGDMVSDKGETAYATTKAALVGLTKSLAREFAEYNITVNAICPGYVKTPMADSIAKQSNEKNPNLVIKGIVDGVPLKRLAEPKEIGELAAFLGSDESSYITGTQVVIDGGSTLPETVSIGV
ncbi:SDR family oxidoreductase UcpA [Clostridium oceanicum]|uniref:SDR family oxidoreductase UcpA n=1 Tax=Clostridium oceanicum TaxID=1543 RepID=A0ABP3UF33_9CLOT